MVLLFPREHAVSVSMANPPPPPFIYPNKEYKARSKLGAGLPLPRQQAALTSLSAGCPNRRSLRTGLHGTSQKSQGRLMKVKTTLGGSRKRAFHIFFLRGRRKCRLRPVLNMQCFH